METQNSGNPSDELARAIERIDDPDALLVEARRIVGSFFGEPAFAVAQQILAQHGVDGAVGFGHGIVSDLVFGFDRAGSEAGEDRASGVQGGFDALQNVGVEKKSYACVIPLAEFRI